MEKEGMVKIFLDDYRMPIECTKYMHTRIGVDNIIYLEDWVVVKNYDQFVSAIMLYGDAVSHVSFDHDLADEHYATCDAGDEEVDYTEYKEKTGVECAKWLKEYCERNEISLPVVYVHSMNPIGCENIKNVFK